MLIFRAWATSELSDFCIIFSMTWTTFHFPWLTSRTLLYKKPTFFIRPGHPTTIFCKISVRRSKNCQEFSLPWGRLKISRWLFNSCTIFEPIYQVNSIAPIFWSLIFRIPLPRLSYFSQKTKPKIFGIENSIPKISCSLRTIFSLHCRKETTLLVLFYVFHEKGIQYTIASKTLILKELYRSLMSVIAAVIVIVSNYFSKVFASFHEFCCDAGSVDMSPWCDVDNYRIPKQSSRLPYPCGIPMWPNGLYYVSLTLLNPFLLHGIH